MLTKTQLDEYRADYQIRNLVVLGILTLISGCFAFAMHIVHSEPFSSWVLWSTIAAVVMSIAITVKTIETSRTDAWSRYKTHTRIGYQVIWMLDKDGELDNRIEHRNYQDARENTSAWVVCEPLGGPDRRMYIATGDRDRPQYAISMSYLRVTRSTEHHVRVRGVVGTSGDEQMLLSTLLRILNATGGHLGTNACDVLMRHLNDANNNLAEKSVVVEGLLKTIEGSRQQVNDMLGEKEQLRAELVKVRQSYKSHSEISEGARNALVAIVDLANKRSTRVSDIREMASEELRSIMKLCGSSSL